MGILLARILEWVAITSSYTYIYTHIYTHIYSHGIFQARVLEWAAIAFSEKQSLRWRFSGSDILGAVLSGKQRRDVEEDERETRWTWLRK